MMPESQPLDVEFTETPYAPSVAPPQGITRADVLTQARILSAEISGVAALVEGGVGKPGMRHEFVDAWRKWAGSWSGFYISLERLPFDIEKTDEKLKRHANALRVWRQGLQFELAPAQTAQQGVPTPQTAPAEKKGWPWWGSLLAIGGGGIVLWKVGQWLFSSPYQSTGAAISDVVETGSAVNDVRKARQQTR
jgi:hypothetical protein